MDTIKLNGKEYNVVEVYKNKKILATRNNKKYIIIPFTTIEGLNNYLKNKKEIKRNKIEASKVLKVDKQGLLVLENFITGRSLLNVCAYNLLDARAYLELFRVYRNNRFAKVALSYKPENFVYHGKYFYYISDEIYNFTDKTAFEKSEDIKLWLNSNAQKRYIESKGYKYLSRDLIKDGGELNKKIVLLCTANW